jgi:vacuolar-type H+-ATPase subunit F/Vma7
VLALLTKKEVVFPERETPVLVIIGSLTKKENKEVVFPERETPVLVIIGSLTKKENIYIMENVL